MTLRHRMVCHKTLLVARSAFFEKRSLTKRKLGPSFAVFDLPQLYTKPSATDILKALELLAVRPRTFSKDEHLEFEHWIHSSGISQYLTSIIASALAWVDTDELREQIWEAASTRLCERSGRSGKLPHKNQFRV